MVSDRLADMIAEFGGSWKFISASIAFFALWMILNTLLRERAFDFFPYNLLNLMLGMITGLQAPIIMMSQNRQSEKDRLRADLDYQVNLKNELALGEVLRRLDVLESERLPILFDQQYAWFQAWAANPSFPNPSLSLVGPRYNRSCAGFILATARPCCVAKSCSQIWKKYLHHLLNNLHRKSANPCTNRHEGMQ